MINAENGDDQSALFSGFDQALGFQVPDMEIEMIIGTSKHPLHIKSNHAWVLRMLSPSFVEGIEDQGMRLCVSERRKIASRFIKCRRRFWPGTICEVEQIIFCAALGSPKGPISLDHPIEFVYIRSLGVIRVISFRQITIGRSDAPFVGLLTELKDFVIIDERLSCGHLNIAL